MLSIGCKVGLLQNPRGITHKGNTETAAHAAPARPRRPGTQRAYSARPNDELVRQLVGALSSHPTVAAWLATDGLLRSFTVAVENVADGNTPARRLPALRPAGQFHDTEDDDKVLIDARNYEQYAPLAAAIDSLNAEGTARLYSTLKPRLEEAYAELGRQRSFDVALEQAFVEMLRTPALDGQVRVVPKGAALYAFEDPRSNGDGGADAVGAWGRTRA